mmetsp:Transcript_3268/g.10733  ORF Transcript_3268/g.10733 Transcript_3268/m.10733 type:complete len:216 (-) Transcript_3268:663-1310(-)
MRWQRGRHPRRHDGRNERRHGRREGRRHGRWEGSRLPGGQRSWVGGREGRRIPCWITRRVPRWITRWVPRWVPRWEGGWVGRRANCRVARWKGGRYTRCGRRKDVGEEEAGAGRAGPRRLKDNVEVEAGRVASGWQRGASVRANEARRRACAVVHANKVGWVDGEGGEVVEDAARRTVSERGRAAQAPRAVGTVRIVDADGGGPKYTSKRVGCDN